MRRLLYLGVATLTAALTVGGLASPAMAARATFCTGTLAPGSYGAVIVPAGAVCTSDGPVTIRGGVRVDPGGSFILGGEGGTSTIIGGISATDPAQVQVHFATIIGRVDIRGGSGAFGGPFGIFFSTIEDNHITGGVTIDGYDGFWLGFIRNRVGGNVVLTNNVSVADPDSNEYVTNSIRGNLICSGNSPAPQIGDSEGEPNVVSGRKTGQCAAL